MARRIIKDYDLEIRIGVADTGDPVFDALQAIAALRDYLMSVPPHVALREGAAPSPTGHIQQLAIVRVLRTTQGGLAPLDEERPTLSTILTRVDASTDKSTNDP